MVRATETVFRRYQRFLTEAGISCRLAYCFLGYGILAQSNCPLGIALTLNKNFATSPFPVGTCIYGQVIKKRRENRVVRVDRRLLLGSAAELEEALFHSEDSSTLNTSFIERHNLSIRQGCAYLAVVHLAKLDELNS